MDAKKQATITSILLIGSFVIFFLSGYFLFIIYKRKERRIENVRNKLIVLLQALNEKIEENNEMGEVLHPKLKERLEKVMIGLSIPVNKKKENTS